MLEMLLVVLVLGIIAAFAIPQALNAVKAYRLHSDASAVAAQLSVARFRATSQNTPYRVNIRTSTTPPSFDLERLCGATPSSVDSNCTSAYQPFSTASIEGGSQYLASGNAFTSTNPGGTVYPAPLTGGSASTVFYFNTRGMPVTSTGEPLTNGGAVIYVTNNANLTDGVVVTVGGRVSVYQWNPAAGAWRAR
jgi:type II secretory pathway pseudopilin PulG